MSVKTPQRYLSRSIRMLSRVYMRLILSMAILLPLQAEAAFERAASFNPIPLSSDRCGFIRLSFDHPFGIREIEEHLLEGKLRRNRWAFGGRIHNFGLFDGEARYVEWNLSFGLGTKLSRLGLGLWISGYRLEIGDDRASGFNVGSSVSIWMGGVEIGLGKEIPIRKIERSAQPTIAFLFVSGKLLRDTSLSASLEGGMGYFRFPVKLRVDLKRRLILHIELEPSLWSVSVGFDVGYGPIYLRYMWETHPSLPDTHRFGLTIRVPTGNASQSPPSDS